MGMGPPPFGPHMMGPPPGWGRDPYRDGPYRDPRDRDRSRDRDRARDWERGKPRDGGPKKDDPKAAEEKKKLEEQKKVEEIMSAEMSEEDKMRMLMGFGGFDSTKVCRDKALRATNGQRSMLSRGNTLLEQTHLPPMSSSNELIGST